MVTKLSQHAERNAHNLRRACPGLQSPNLFTNNAKKYISSVCNFPFGQIHAMISYPLHAIALYRPRLHRLGQRNALAKRTQAPFPLDHWRLHRRRRLSHWPAVKSISRRTLSLMPISIPSRRALQWRTLDVGTETAVSTRSVRRRRA